jgi:hydrogenase expression/formation protein HypD
MKSRTSAIRPEQSFRNRALAERISTRIHRIAASVEGDIRIMEVCGTHTVALRRCGIRSLLPKKIRFISGPGCPVCVTPAGFISNALRLIEEHGATIATFGDMVKVPDPDGRSLSAYLGTGRVRILYSPRELLSLAREVSEPVVFLGVGFETTIPTVASVFLRAQEEGIQNLYLAAAFKTVPVALRTLVSDPECAVSGFLLPGHVSVIIGLEPYRFLAEEFGLPGVIGGFEPIDMLFAVLGIVEQLAHRTAAIENAYRRAVRDEGNEEARKVMERLLVPAPALWRGLGRLEGSGLRLREEMQAMDADRVFGLPEILDHDPPGCLCARVIQGKALPAECALFGRRCTPDRPVGPCMVSSEGTCAAHLRYREEAE